VRHSVEQAGPRKENGRRVTLALSVRDQKLVASASSLLLSAACVFHGFHQAISLSLTPAFVPLWTCPVLLSGVFCSRSAMLVLLPSGAGA